MRLAVQFGLGYAPLTIAQEQELFERYLPGVEVEWMQFGSGGAIREALIAGELDAAVMGVPPFLIGWDKGAEWRVAAGVCVMPLGLQTYDSEIQSLADFGEGDKIAYPSPGSIQHILLSMAAERELGDATALDHLGVAMAHPDGAAALLSQRDIVAHFTSPPYIFEELNDPNIHQVVDGTEAFGTDFTFLVAVATQDFHDNNPQAYSAFVMGLTEAIAFINENPEEAASILAPSFNLDEETTLEYLTWPGMNYTTTPYGLMGFAPFMLQAGYIERVPEDLSDIAWENVLAAIGHAAGEPSPIELLQQRP
jgi:NitT/TauT family transport system substrate-binding protein